MSLNIKEQPNVFDDDFLDVIGNEFKFDHVKGLAEWMKNSADAYTRADVADSGQVIYLRFTPKADGPAQFACIDFVGMSSADIDQAFKRWGDRRAASRGTNKRTLGGHGNGGKFYMRQMFGLSHFITYRAGRLNVFGFNERRRYGYAEGFRDKKLSLAEAMAFVRLDGLELPSAVRARWNKSVPGFTVVVGEKPDRLKAWSSQIREICQKLQVHPQSRRLVRYKQVYAWTPSSAPIRLQTSEPEPKPGFEGPFRFEIPSELKYENEEFAYRNRKFPKAHLTLWSSREPFGRSETSGLNGIDILGEVGCIGSYRMHELGRLRFGAQTEFLYGECYCPVLEDPTDDCVRNDREKLVEAPKTLALLAWIRDRVDEVAARIADEERQEKKKAELRQSSVLNELLNRWKNKFMTRVFADVMVGFGPAEGFGSGGTGGTEPWVGGGGKSSGSERKGGAGLEGKGGSGEDKSGKAPRAPQVLLSGYDSDPLNPEEPKPFDLDPRHPAVYQRPEDVSRGIYWINTSRPLAQRIIEQYKVKSTRWREYLFQRYVDIIMKEAVYQLAKKDPQLTAEKVEDVWDKVQSRVHDSASDDLEAFLFEESFGANG